MEGVTRRTSVILFCIICFLSRTQGQSDETNKYVETSLGTIVGQVSNRESTDGLPVYEFLGIPYSEPPTGEMRWRAPVYSSPSTTGFVNLQVHGRPCYQDKSRLDSMLGNTRFTNDVFALLSATMSEDCLFMNIYAPEKSEDNEEKLPVMVFIHGGDFNAGTGSMYKGTELASLKNVIVVTLNYRLGPFGFMYSEDGDMTGNFGLMDQEMALLWVHNNIESFGGDRNSVTLFGEEAGGSSVHLHLLDTETKNATLFHRVIIQSASFDDGVWTTQHGVDEFRDFTEKLQANTGDVNITENLRNSDMVSSEDIFTASNEWHPIMSDSPTSFMSNEHFNKKVDVMVGSNNCGGKEIIQPNDDVMWLKNLTYDVINTAFTQKYGTLGTDDVVDKMSKNYLQYYIWSGADDETASMPFRNSFSSVLYTDQVFETWAQSISEGISPSCNCSVYKYVFEKNNDQTDQNFPLGALLSDELCYLFGYSPNGDSLLMQRVMNVWTNFARTGNPNSETEYSDQLTYWPSYHSDENEDSCRETIRIGSSGVLRRNNDKVSARTWKFWELFYDTLGFSCSAVNSTILNDSDDIELIEADSCGETVGEIIGLEGMSNDTAAILLITFWVISGVFVLFALIMTCCYCSLKRKVKKTMKKIEKVKKDRRNGKENFSYKL